MRDRRTIVMQADATHDYLIDHGLSDNLILAKTVPEALRRLSNGEGDVVLAPRLVGLLTAKKLGLTNIEISDLKIDVYGRGYGFAVHEGNAELLAHLNQGLSIVKATGQYDEIYEKWFGIVDPIGVPRKTIYKYAYIIGSVFLAMMSLVLLWSWSIKKEIKQRKHSENKLKESETRFRNLYENAPQAYQSLNDEGKLVAVNNAWLKILGYSKEEVLGQRMENFLSDHYKKLFKTRFPEFKKAGQMHEVEFEMVRKDGRKTQISVEGRVSYDKKGDVDQTHCLLSDISEKRLLEKKLQQAQKMESIGILAGGIAHDFNNILGSILGYNELALDETKSTPKLNNYLEQVQIAGIRAKNLVAQLLAFSRQTDEVMNPMEITPLLKEVVKLIRSTIPTSIEINTHITAPDSIINADPTGIHQILMNLCGNAASALEQTGGQIDIHLDAVKMNHPTASRGVSNSSIAKYAASGGELYPERRLKK